MTNGEAIRRLDYMDWFLQTRYNDYSERDHDAFLLAIKALEFIEKNHSKTFKDYVYGVDNGVVNTGTDKTCINCIHKDVCYMYRLNYISARDGHCTNYYEKSKNREWIPVNIALPEMHKEVIVTDIETSGTYVSRYIGDGYWECDNGPFKNRIIAWQLLPEPYKEGEEE